MLMSGASGRREANATALTPGAPWSSAITRLRGVWHDYRGVKVMPTFHPAYLLRNPADKKLVCEMTLWDGRILYDLNGLARPDWGTLPKGYRTTGNARWDGYSRR